MGSPPLSAPANGSQITDPNMHRGPSTPSAYHPSIPPILNVPSRDVRSSASQVPLAPLGQPTVGDFHSSYANPPGGQPSSFTPSAAVLPPFSSIGAIGAGTIQGSSAVPYLDNSQRSHGTRNYHVSTPAGSKRTLQPSSDVTSADSSEVDDDENGELPASGLVAPWEVLRGLADVAIQRAAKVSAGVPLNMSLGQLGDVRLRRVAKRAANPRAEPERLPLTDRIVRPKEGRFVTKSRVA